MVFLRLKTFILLFWCVAGFLSCKNTYYTLSGSTATGTIQVVSFNNMSGAGPPFLPQKLTEDMKSYYLQNSRLRVVNTSQADYILEGDITGYGISPLAATANGTAAQTRLTISVKIRFTDNKNPENNVEESFSRYEDFPQSSNFAQVENTKIQEIFDKIILDIFQKTASNW